MGSTLIGKNLLQWEHFFLYDMTPISMVGNNGNDRIASPESVPIHLNSLNSRNDTCICKQHGTSRITLGCTLVNNAHYASSASLKMQATPLFGIAFSGVMNVCWSLIGFIIKVKYFFLNAMFIYYYKKWSLFTRMFSCIYLGSEKCKRGLLKFSRLIYCGPGLFVLKIE